MRSLCLARSLLQLCFFEVLKSVVAELNSEYRGREIKVEIEIDIEVRYKETTLSHMSYRKLAKFRKYAKRRALMLAMIGIHHRMNNKQKKREDD